MTSWSKGESLQLTELSQPASSNAGHICGKRSTNHTEDNWEHMLKLVISSSIRAGHGLLWCKIQFRIHYTPPNGLLHMLWIQPRLSLDHNIWNTAKCCNVTITPNSCTAIFGVPCDDRLSGSWKRSFATLPASCLIILQWKRVSTPTFDERIKGGGQVNELKSPDWGHFYRL